MPTADADPARPTPPARDFCATLASSEPLAGTAPYRPVWALVEHPGPWGHAAVEDAPWPVPDLGARLAAAAETAAIRLVLARRPRRRGTDVTVVDPTDPLAPRRALLARCGPGGWFAERAVPTAELADLDWAALASSARVPEGWTATGAVWGVCTHGTRDACCARLGRPLAQAFDAADPGAVWEVSHTGGHRFAGVAVHLPSGQLYGRVAPADAPRLVEAVRAGRAVDELLRGEVHRPPADQVASAALRGHLGDDRLGSLTLVEGTWEHLAPDGELSRWEVTVESEPGPVRPPSCGTAPEPSTVLRVATLRRRADPPARSFPPRPTREQGSDRRHPFDCP